MEQDLLQKALSKHGVKCSDDGVLQQLSSAASAQGLVAKDVASQLSAWRMNQKDTLPPLLDSSQVTRFLSTLQRGKENQSGGRGGGAGGGTPAGKWGSGGAGAAGGGTPGFAAGLPLAATPQGKTASGRVAAAAGGSPLLATTPGSAPRSAFKARTNRGQVVSTFNPSVPAAQGQEGVRMVHAVPRGVQLPARHLYLLERLEDKVAAVNSRIGAWQQWLAAALASAAGAGGAGGGGDAENGGGSRSSGVEWAPVGAPVQEDCYFAGRIVCEVEGGQLNDTAVMLEGDSGLSEGGRVHLNLSQLGAYRLFPGQVVAVRGINPSGSCILVKQLWSHLPPPTSSATAGKKQQSAAAASGGSAADGMDIDSAAALEDVAGGQLGGGGSSGGLSAVVAAGPFCLADGLLGYEPLAELLAELKTNPPNMLVLLGPFVDVESPLIAGGMMDITYAQLFQSQILERLESWQSSLPVPCQVVLMPAVRDAFHHPTFPQPAINLMAPQQDQQLVSLQNPCTFSAGPALMAAQTTDVLRHLSGVELAKNAAGVATDRLAALASHVVGQRRFYPLYPPPLGTCLDLTGDAALQLHTLPHLLLLPSDLAPFAKAVAASAATEAGGTYQQPPAAAAETAEPRVVVVNPGRLAKGNSGGTYARITVAEGSGSIADRARVDIVRV